MPPRRIRRPLLALIILIVAVVIGYTWQAVRAESTPAGTSSGAPAVTAGLAPWAVCAGHT